MVWNDSPVAGKSARERSMNQKSGTSEMIGDRHVASRTKRTLSVGWTVLTIGWSAGSIGCASSPEAKTPPPAPPASAAPLPTDPPPAAKKTSEPYGIDDWWPNRLDLRPLKA